MAACQIDVSLDLWLSTLSPTAGERFTSGDLYFNEMDSRSGPKDQIHSTIVSKCFLGCGLSPPKGPGHSMVTKDNLQEPASKDGVVIEEISKQFGTKILDAEFPRILTISR